MGLRRCRKSCVPWILLLTLSIVSLDSTSRVIVLPVTVGGQYRCAINPWIGRQTGLHEDLHDDLIPLVMFIRSVLVEIAYLDKALSSSVRCKVVLQKKAKSRASQPSKFSADASETWHMTKPGHRNTHPSSIHVRDDQKHECSLLLAHVVTRNPSGSNILI